MKQNETAETPKTKRNIFIVTALVAAAVIAFATACNKGNTANVMRLLRTEGTVSIEDSKGNSKPVMENLRFQSGDALVTGADGLASVGLDDTKIITLQNNSRSEFIKNGKQLELKLTKGAVFFNVTEKLRSDEKFEIKTSTMTAGIRGTSGIVYYDPEDAGRESLMVTDGVVEVSATNPADNVTRSVKVEGGKSVKVYFYENDTKHDSVEFELCEITEDDLSKFLLGWMADDESLLNRISEYTGWDKDNLRPLLRRQNLRKKQQSLLPRQQPRELLKKHPEKHRQQRLRPKSPQRSLLRDRREDRQRSLRRRQQRKQLLQNPHPK